MSREYRVVWNSPSGRRSRIYQTADSAIEWANDLVANGTTGVGVEHRDVGMWRDDFDRPTKLSWFLAVVVVDRQTRVDHHAQLVRCRDRERALSLIEHRWQAPSDTTTIFVYDLGVQSPRADTEGVYSPDWRLPNVHSVVFRVLPGADDGGAVEHETVEKVPA